MFPANTEKFEGIRKFASFDGDADRLIYFWCTAKNELKLIDGDKQFALLSVYIQE
jgi:phosphoacetylglucosamine mutase